MEGVLMKKVMLVILDGFGYREEKNGNKVKYTLAKWTTVKKIICDLGYSIEDKKSGKVRYSIINKAA